MKQWMLLMLVAAVCLTAGEPAKQEEENLPEVTQDLVVTSSPTGEAGETFMGEAERRKVRANVTGELLRELTGVDAVRRGPIGLDPVVRGLRESQVGIYMDGTRIFAGGPGRMDSGLSHMDPAHVTRVRVVKGPYALTWGAGNLAAVRADTLNPADLGDVSFGGSLQTGYQDNLGAAMGTVEAHGRQGRFAWMVLGASRTADDYEDGDGNTVPGDLTSREARLKLSWQLDSQSDLTLGYARQEQRDLDYPGRLLDAVFFDVDMFSLDYRRRIEMGIFDNLEASLYQNNIDHGMNNDQKPTAQANPNRMPPFPLEVLVDTFSDTSGGRLMLQGVLGEGISLDVGADFVRSDKLALRTISRRDTGMQMAQDNMWPDAVIDDLGLFTRYARTGASQNVSLAVRLDQVEADASLLTPFYLENAGDDPQASETNLSAAATWSHQLQQNWQLMLGLGSVVRTADANERYSDRIPSTKAQTSAEFMGNPYLDPERANQLDLWLEGGWGQTRLNLNLFARRVDDYITIEATDLPRRLPLSPPVVYRYINGDADFRGAELNLNGDIQSAWSWRLAAAYLHGQDRELDEPVIGISPFQVDGGLTYSWGNDQQFDLLWREVAEQDRIALSRFETATDGYSLLNLTYSGRLMPNLYSRVGVHNALDEAYINHLNAKNPFTGQQIAEAGRVFHINLQYRF